MADVNRVARAYLALTNRTVGLHGPTDDPQRTAVPATPALAEMIGEYKGREGSSVGEAFDVDPLKIEERTTRSKIEGIDVTLLPKKTRGNTVIVRLTLRYGTNDSRAGAVKACEYLPTLMARGTKQLTRQQLQDLRDHTFAWMVASGQYG